jgi:adenine-specific DNA-methyltransferase
MLKKLPLHSLNSLATKKSEYSLLAELESLKKELKRLKSRKKYGLVWEDKPEQVVNLCKEKLPVLLEDSNKDIKTSKEKPTDILIEGDNYQALSVLNYTHRGKIDVIYADPPYNTGAKDWKYNNDYVDKEDAYRHSKWLSFMSKRLRLAKNLLSKNGVLICTIDENEFNRLGLLLEELFPSYKITCVTIVHNPAGIQGDNFSYSHEYAFFVYPAGRRSIGMQVREENDIDIRNFRDVTGNESLRSAAANCFYPVLVKDNQIVGFGDVSEKKFHPESINVKRKDGTIEIYPIDPKGIERKWRFARQTVESIKDELEVKFIKNRKVYDIIRNKNSFNYKTVWTDSKYSANNHGTQLLNQIIKSGSFSYPKSIYAVIDCIKAASNENKDAIVLDFFAGSGTTGQAVMALNKADKGNRRYILCTNNENNICTEVCYPRLKSIIKGYKNLKNDSFVEGLGGNLKYFKTDFVEANSTDLNKKRLVDKSTEMLSLKEDCFELIKQGNGFKIFTNNNEKFLGIVYDDIGIDPFKKEVGRLNKKITAYIFSLDDSAREEEFEGIEQLVELKPIPAVILNVYKRIFK